MPAPCWLTGVCWGDGLRGGAACCPTLWLPTTEGGENAGAWRTPPPGWGASPAPAWPGPWPAGGCGDLPSLPGPREGGPEEGLRGSAPSTCWWPPYRLGSCSGCSSEGGEEGGGREDGGGRGGEELGVLGELLEPAAEDKGSAGGLWFTDEPLAPPWPGPGASGGGETPSASGPG